MSVNQMQFIVDAVVRGGKLPTPEDTFRVGDLSVDPGRHGGIATVLKLVRELGIDPPQWDLNDEVIIAPEVSEENQDGVQRVVAGIVDNQRLTCVPGTKALTDKWLACMQVIEEFKIKTREALRAMPDLMGGIMDYSTYTTMYPQTVNTRAHVDYVVEELAKATLANPTALGIWLQLYNSLNNLLQDNGFELDGRVCLTRQETQLHSVLAHLMGDKTSEAVDVIGRNHSLLDMIDILPLARSYVAGYMNPERVATLGQTAREQHARKQKPTLQSIGASTEIPDVRNPVRAGFNKKLIAFLSELNAEGLTAC